MAQSEKAYPKCKQPMQQGFPIDRGGPTVAEWVEGPREYGWFGVRWRRKERLPIVAYRCLSYGYLESHANPG